MVAVGLRDADVQMISVAGVDVRAEWQAPIIDQIIGAALGIAVSVNPIVLGGVQRPDLLSQLP